MKQTWVRTFRLKIMVASILLNMFGAGLAFVYFTFIRTGLMPGPRQLDVRTQTWYFVSVMIVIFSAAILVSTRYPGRLWRDLAAVGDETEPRRVKAVVDKFLNLPFASSALSLFAWLAAGVLYGILPPFLLFHTAEAAQWYRSYQVFFGIVFVGAPYTVICLYFITEWMVRVEILSVVPPGVLTSVPRSFRLNVLPKVLFASLLIGTLPVTIISYVTLDQIHEVTAGMLDPQSFIEKMPLVIAFLLSLAVLMAVALSVFVARSVSEPLRELRSSMNRIRKGNLDVIIPVVSSDEIGGMAEGFNRMVAGLRERDFIKDTFGSYLSPEVVSEILSSPAGVNLGGELRDVTILVADLRGFTALVASVGPEVVVKILNRFLEKMVDIIIRYEGTVDEFTGDGILAFFGAPRVMIDAPARAVQCSIDMQKVMHRLNEELQSDLTAGQEETQGPNPVNGGHSHAGQLALRMGIAINKGPLIVGNIGCEQRRKYGAVGTPINVAFRIERLAEEGAILISEEVYKSVADEIAAEPMPGVELKGIDRPVTLYRVIHPEKATTIFQAPEASAES
ncbi:MAG: adenylate/guanylate cyclase domain-containing protein [Desulfomonilaceae bacterium]